MKVVKQNTMEKLTMTQGALLTLEQAISMFENSQSELPFKIWYGLNKTRKSIAPQLEVINESRTKLLDKHVEKADNGQYKTKEVGQAIIFDFKSDKDRESFDEAMKPVLEEEIDVSLYKMDLDLFDSMSTTLREQPLLGIIIEYLVK
jgi:hypothetical protein